MRLNGIAGWRRHRLEQGGISARQMASEVCELFSCVAVLLAVGIEGMLDGIPGFGRVILTADVERAVRRLRHGRPNVLFSFLCFRSDKDE